MARYIDKDDLLGKFNAICSTCGKINENNGAMCRACYFDDAKDIVDDMPTADVKPIVKGEWIDCGLYVYGCSNCHNSLEMWWEDKYKFCPNCGADMRKESEEEK